MLATPVCIAGCSGVLYLDCRAARALVSTRAVGGGIEWSAVYLMPRCRVPCASTSLVRGVVSREVRLMAEPAAPVPGRVFINYRREETAYPAGWLYDRLANRYGGQVFKD